MTTQMPGSGGPGKPPAPNSPAAGPAGAKATGVELNEILGTAMKAGASDIHIKAGLPPVFRIDGELYPYKEAPRLSPDVVNKMAFSIMTKPQQDKF